jgi:hypothetical protein
MVYTAALAFWLVTRALVLVHQGAWPWMNAFVVAAARGILVGDWNDAVRPQLPAVLGVPLALAGASEQQMVAVLYVLASLVQFGAFLFLVRTIFPDRLSEQTLALLIFLLVPFNHSIHHYRDLPVVLASAAIFLLSADFIRQMADARPQSDPSGQHLGRQKWYANQAGSPSDRQVGVPSGQAGSPSERQVGVPGGREATLSVPAAESSGGPRGPLAPFESVPTTEPRNSEGRLRRAALLLALMLLGIWSRIEVVAFVGVLVLAALLIWRRKAIRLAITYVAAAGVVTVTLLVMYRVEDVDLSQAWFYTAHTFLDSTPDSWLTPECRANPTENCREADGLSYFGPANLRDGVLALALNHPLVTAVKSVRSAWDNAWVLLGPNLSTFPLVVPFLALALALFPQVRDQYRRVPLAVWVVAVAIAAESVLPPLTWAPPHPQYHVALVLPIVILLVPALLALVRLPRGRWLAFGFLLAEASLSAFRYTRYPGY